MTVSVMSEWTASSSDEPWCPEAALSHWASDAGPSEEAKAEESGPEEQRRPADNKSVDEPPDNKARDIEDIFVIHRNGNLMSSVTTNIYENLDRDVLGSMIMAVTDFIQQSFRPSCSYQIRPKLLSIRLEGREIAFVHGRHIMIALVLPSDLPPDDRRKVSEAVQKLEAENRELLDGWDGNQSNVQWLGDYLMQILLR